MSDPSAFLSLWRQGRDQLDEVFAETFAIEPMAQAGNSRPIPDPSRLTQAFQAGYLSPSADRYGQSPGHADNAGQKAVSSHPSLLMSEENLPYRPSPPDAITRAATGERFVVSTVEPDGYGRLVINLTMRSAG